MCTIFSAQVMGEILPCYVEASERGKRRRSANVECLVIKCLGCQATEAIKYGDIYVFYGHYWM